MLKKQYIQQKQTTDTTHNRHNIVILNVKRCNIYTLKQLLFYTYKYFLQKNRKNSFFIQKLKY
jgi:hypothetical protein